MTLPDTMRAVVLMGHGDLDQLAYRTDWPRPEPSADQVLIKVEACGMNNTDINTRSGWYSKTVSEATTGGGYEEVDEDDPTWGGAPISLPRIQGADVVGTVVAVGANADASLVGKRVMTDNWLRDWDDPLNKDKTGYFGSEADGGYAEYTVIDHRNVQAVNSDMSSVELATFSCSYTTAEGMLSRANVADGDTVLITGASGGVGSALIQLAKRRGAKVVAMSSESKHAQLAELNPDVLLPRNVDDLAAELKKTTGHDKVTVVADVVGGGAFGSLLDVLERGGRYTCSGAIAGPIVDFDLRTFYLKDITMTGSTVVLPHIFEDLVRYIEAGDLRALVAETVPLADFHAGQVAFVKKSHIGNFVVVP
ncbi:NADPH:quinone reductase [Cognatiyoonia sediminum]|uniref:NADPH:quinone reductase n=1 Tax=Cognatiyoonia sediminum TaxID=1508389 RepID=A0A1M5SCQ7_9RHOB|nr:alcohol dehydrogenase family protein [Cognatiyoonia sediminum]SHH36259.1 NADPH:quinone reductase [Cognatiyoonia sediminum]